MEASRKSQKLFPLFNGRKVHQAYPFPLRIMKGPVKEMGLSWNSFILCLKKRIGIGVVERPHCFVKQWSSEQWFVQCFKGTGYTWYIFHHFFEERQPKGLPVSLPVHQNPSGKGSTLKGKNLLIRSKFFFLYGRLLLTQDIRQKYELSFLKLYPFSLNVCLCVHLFVVGYMTKKKQTL